jgi:hypothetical protein
VSLADNLLLHVVFGGCFAAMVPDAFLLYSRWMLSYHGFIAFVGNLALMYFSLYASPVD